MQGQLRHRIPLLLLVLALSVAVLTGGAQAAEPTARAASTCADHSTQAEAQRAADTRDADGDGVYCESLPCPCSSGGGDGSNPPPTPAPKKPSCVKPSAVQRISFSKTKYRNIREHYIDSVGSGWPRILVVNRPGVDTRRDRLHDPPAHQRGSVNLTAQIFWQQSSQPQSGRPLRIPASRVRGSYCGGQCLREPAWCPAGSLQPAMSFSGGRSEIPATATAASATTVTASAWVGLMSQRLLESQRLRMAMRSAERDRLEPEVDGDLASRVTLAVVQTALLLPRRQHGSGSGALSGVTAPESTWTA